MNAPALGLLGPLIRRDIAGRYRGSLFGVLWSLLTPLFMLAVYTLAFGSLFQSRWSTADGAPLEGTGGYALVLFGGLIVFQLFSEVVGKAPTLVLGNPSYVKKVVFPLEILPVVALGSALFHTAVSVLVLLVFILVLRGGVPVTGVLAPLVLLPFLVLLLGLGWLLAAIGVYFRDIGQFLTPLITALMFLSPIFTPMQNLPAVIRDWVVLNPLTVPVNELRRTLIFGELPDWGALALYLVVAVVIAGLGYLFFQKTRKGFADVL